LSIKKFAQTTPRKIPKTIEEKINFGNFIREQYQQKGILGIGALRAIRRIRQLENYPAEITVLEKETISTNASKVLDGHAFIIRQFKTKEETQILSDLYGRQFIQVSISDTKDARCKRLVNRLKIEDPGALEDQIDELSRRLIRVDEDEKDEKDSSKKEFGQHVGDVYHFGDVFVDGRSKASIKKTTSRFIDALFGRNDISPSVDEFGSYTAKSVSLRSADLSRQVGAAIFSADGDIISMGCNEVPKPLGGNYSDDDDEKHRDIDDGVETNKLETNRIIHNFLDVLESLDALRVLSKDFLDNKENLRRIQDSMIGDITEYGRMVHAEMNALAEAARTGRKVLGATCFVTTFPCHNCAKHLIAAGIDRIVFIEPYPKSKTLEMYSYAISQDHTQTGKVRVEHFVGISPRRFRDIFEKGKRRRSDGTIKEWNADHPFPAIPVRSVLYSSAELSAILKALA
jgi:deoxycytidylate deaminase